MRRLSLISCILLVGIFFVSANPVGEEVSYGQATFLRNGSSLNIQQASESVIINWTDFSIAEGELTQFIQPSSSSSALNRVIASNPSEIYGQLRGNGNIYLINPYGILIGPSGLIETNTFIGSTLDITNENYLSGGNLNFFGESEASIYNMGAISATGGDVYLMAHEVRNEGVVSASNGNVGMASAHEVMISEAGEDRLSVVLTGEEYGSDGGIINEGVIEAAQVELRAVGGNAYALAINNSGRIHATSYENRGGRIWLTAETADIEKLRRNNFRCCRSL